jgi:hypothetical protein
VIDRYQFEERIAICLDSGMDISEAETVAARQFFKSCNILTADDKSDADRLGWSMGKMFRMINRKERYDAEKFPHVPKH